MAHLSTDGYEWNPQDGLKLGLLTDAVITPAELNVAVNGAYDVIVIGAGYAGLRALRDLATQGLKTLLLEGRNRIGGRSWTTKKDSYVYEVGGAWIHRDQALVWSEILRYGFADRLKDSYEFYERSRTPTISRNGKIHEVPWRNQTTVTGWEKFCNIDGQMGMSVFNLPACQWLDNEEFIKWDAMSCQDRLEQIKDQLSPEEEEAIFTILYSMSKIPLSWPSFAEVLRWTALSGGTLDGLAAVTTGSGERFTASSVVVAVPLNCLSDIAFEPALGPVKAEAIALGHTNHTYKVCVEANGKHWRNWSGHAFPDKGIPFLQGDGITLRKLVEALQYLNPDLKIERLFGADYFSDPLSKGGWAVHGPGYVTKYLRDLQAPAGNIHFANADWADVWRGFIDGALESGALAAAAILNNRPPRG